ncbi:MAG TPA: DUF4386 domain-containing protein [Thermoleophilia bacterium]|nr:DUF4386 domain-containing protein [Thermoleophilia bacterium]
MNYSATSQLPRKKMARLTGGLYLAFILASVLADLIGHVGIADVEQAYDVLANHPWQFSLGLVIALLSAFLFLMAAWGLYVLLRPVNQDLALLFLLLNAIGVAIQCVSMFPLIFATLLGDGSSFMQAYSAGQVEGLMQISIDLYKSSFVVAQLFFGTWLFPLGYLVYRSGFLPRFLGVLLILDGFAVLLWFFQAILLPDYPAIIYPGLALSFVAEVGLGLWLLIKGVKVTEAVSGLSG